MDGLKGCATLHDVVSLQERIMCFITGASSTENSSTAVCVEQIKVTQFATA